MWHSRKPARPARSLDSIAEALLLPSGIDGVYARTAKFEQAVNGLSALISRYRDPAYRSAAIPAGHEPAAGREIGISQELSAFSRLRKLPRRRRARNPRVRRTQRSRRGLDRRAFGRGPRAQPGRLLSGLSAGREPRHRAGNRPVVRRCLRLLPPRAVENARPAAIVPHARICLHRHAGAGRRIPQALDVAGAEIRRANWACPGVSIPPAIRSSAAAAS